MPIDLSFAALEGDYLHLFDTIEIRPEWRVRIDDAAKLVISRKARLGVVERLSTVPWPMIGLLGLRESGLRLDRHLHNGDPLTARTVHEPKHRPGIGSPPFTFEQSAVDALQYDHLTDVGEWSIERIGYEGEKFNGFGYREHRVVDPYLWSGTLHYARGKYDDDGHFNPALVDEEPGIMVVLKRMMELDPSIQFGRLVETGEPRLRDVLVSHPTAAKAALTGLTTLAGAVPIGWSQLLPYAGWGLFAIGIGVFGLAGVDLWRRHQHLTALRVA